MPFLLPCGRRHPSSSINNAGRPSLKWRDTLHEIRFTYLSFVVKFFLKKVIFSLNIPARFVIITIAIEMADSGAPHVLVSADTQKNPFSGKKARCFEHFNLGNLDLFGI